MDLVYVLPSMIELKNILEMYSASAISTDSLPVFLCFVCPVGVMLGLVWGALVDCMILPKTLHLSHCVS